MTGVLTRRGHTTETHNREGRVTTEAEIRVMRPPAKEHLETQELGEAGRVLPWSLRGSTALPVP